MNEDLKNIRDLINSRNNQNLFIGWTMLRQYKKYNKGEFRDTVKELFKIKETKNRIEFYLALEDGFCRVSVFKYNCPNNGNVFSIRSSIKNIKRIHRKTIPISELNGLIDWALNRIILYIDSLIERV